MKIIGITGKLQAGKDTIAAAMIAADPTVRRIALADALKRAASDLLGLSYEQVYGTNEQKNEVDPRWGKSPRQILQALGTEVGRAVHSNVWINKMLEDMSLWERCRITYNWSAFNRRFERVYQGYTKTQAHPIWVVPDVRFKNEAAAIREWGGVILRVRRPGHGLTFKGGLPLGNAVTWTCSDCGAVYETPKPPTGYVDIDSGRWHNLDCPRAHPSELGVEEIEPDYEFQNTGSLDEVSAWSAAFLDRLKASRGWGEVPQRVEDLDFQMVMADRDARVGRWMQPCPNHPDGEHQANGIDRWTCSCGARKA